MRLNRSLDLITEATTGWSLPPKLPKNNYKLTPSLNEIWFGDLDLIIARLGQLGESVLVEKRIATTATYPILQNPTGQELVAFLAQCEQKNGYGEARGYLSENGDVYVWPAFDAIHYNGRLDLVDSGMIPRMNESDSMSLYFSNQPRINTEHGWNPYVVQYGPVWACGGSGDVRGESLPKRSRQLDMLLRGLQRLG